ncbi:MAG: hypothetical protein EOP52_00965 [Sphingobacteriales bacterium]|nr:MAG: hypothetical protein EOP52_00965 [Sphingobacteriales bacterium]
MLFTQPVLGQTRQKTVTQDALVGYLSHTVDAQSLSDMVLHPSRFYPGTTDVIVPQEYYTGSFAPCEIAAIRREDVQSGRAWARYQQQLAFVQRVQPRMMIDAITLWGTWEMDEHLARARHLVADLKTAVPGIVVMGTPCEWVNEGIVRGRLIPPYVWAAFGLLDENRPFDCLKMRDSLSETARGNGFIPQIQHLETQLYFYWLATTYLQLGCEAISFSATNTLGSPSDYPAEWSRVVHRIRAYADTCPAVRFGLITGHSATGFLDTSGTLLFDFHMEPLRPSEDPRNTAYPVGPNGGACILEPAPQCPTLYQNGLGGMNPNGWVCTRNPGLMFFDNFLEPDRSSPASEFERYGQPHPVRRRQRWQCWSPYHFDEISWFALQTKAYRDSFLRYAHYRVHQLDSALYLALPMKRSVAASTDKYAEYTCDGGDHYHARDWWPANYCAVDPDSVFPDPPRVGNYFFAPPDRTRLPLWGGYGQEAVIKELLNKP